MLRDFFIESQGVILGVVPGWVSACMFPLPYCASLPVRLSLFRRHALPWDLCPLMVVELLSRGVKGGDDLQGPDTRSQEPRVPIPSLPHTPLLTSVPATASRPGVML